jgi:hypothetical protein
MNSGKNRLKARNLASGNPPVSRESLPARESEEFISPEATPSRDPNDLPCAHCGKPREDWDGPGVEKEGLFFCSEECAKGLR